MPPPPLLLSFLPPSFLPSFFADENTSSVLALKQNKMKHAAQNGRKNKKPYSGKSKGGRKSTKSIADHTPQMDPLQEHPTTDTPSGKKQVAALSCPWEFDAWKILVGPMTWQERDDLQMKAGIGGTPVRLPPPYEGEHAPACRPCHAPHRFLPSTNSCPQQIWKWT
jgi:hypothetical protein